jgi:hypothetical protein
MPCLPRAAGVAGACGDAIAVWQRDYRRQQLPRDVPEPLSDDRACRCRPRPQRTQLAYTHTHVLATLSARSPPASAPATTLWPRSGFRCCCCNCTVVREGVITRVRSQAAAQSPTRTARLCCPPSPLRTDRPSVRLSVLIRVGAAHSPVRRGRQLHGDDHRVELWQRRDNDAQLLGHHVQPHRHVLHSQQQPHGRRRPVAARRPCRSPSRARLTVPAALHRETARTASCS